jgi:hypothetical protein
MKNTLIIFLLTMCMACSEESNIKYFEYNFKNMQSNISLNLQVIDSKNVKRSDGSENYCSMYICKLYGSDKLIKVVSPCTNVKFPMYTFVKMMSCKEDHKDLLMVASTDFLENRVNNLPVYFGRLAIPQ